jgi:hypothetical protein
MYFSLNSFSQILRFWFSWNCFQIYLLKLFANKKGIKKVQGICLILNVNIKNYIFLDNNSDHFEFRNLSLNCFLNQKTAFNSVN